MVLDNTPVHARIIHAATGEQRDVVVAFLLMDDPADDGLTTGWYWAEASRLSKAGWPQAVGNNQGPFRDAGTAFLAAENYTIQRLALAIRLRQAAGLVAAGEIDASPAEIAAWLQSIHDEDRRSGWARVTPVGPDPDARRWTDDKAELRHILATGTVPDERDESCRKWFRRLWRRGGIRRDD